MKYLLKLAAMAMALAWASLSVAVIETYEFSDPSLEERYQALSAELRCPKCQNQNIADSNAPIAQDLRKALHRQLEDGASDGEILDFMVARYGEFVRYRPSFGGVNVLLWLAPAILLLAGFGVLLATLRSKRAAAGAPGELTAKDRERLDALLDSTKDKES